MSHISKFKGKTVYGYDLFKRPRIHSLEMLLIVCYILMIVNWFRTCSATCSLYSIIIVIIL